MKKTNMKIIADTVLDRRKAKNLTQAQLAAVTGLNRATIGRIENEEFMPSIDQLQTLAEALDFDITGLFAEDRTAAEKNPQLQKYRIAVAGTGYVGLSLAVLLAQHNQVTAFDILPEKTALINDRKSPIQDELIEKLVLRQAIAKLPEREKKIVFLRYFRDMTQSEVAKAIGVSQVQISRIESRLMRDLKKEFGE